jgi:hypothetical protein
VSSAPTTPLPRHARMPGCVRIAVVTSLLLFLLGAASIPIFIADIVSDGSGTRWVSHAFRVREGSLRFLFHPMYAPAIGVIRAAVRRDGRVRELAFQFALLLALLLGFFALGASVLAAIQHRMDAVFAAPIVMFGVMATLAWSLSRPSAKAWFAPPPA